MMQSLIMFYGTVYRVVENMKDWTLNYIELVKKAYIFLINKNF